MKPTLGYTNCYKEDNIPKIATQRNFFKMGLVATNIGYIT